MNDINKHEVLDAPAQVGGTVFRKGVRVSTVIGAAQRYYERLQGTPPPQPHVAGAIAAFEAAHPEHYWHIAKGKVTAGEPLYGAIIPDIIGRELGHGESNESAEAAFAIAVTAAGLATTEGKDNA